MRAHRELEARIEEIQADERMSYAPADVRVNAPLALLQVEGEATVQALRWALGKVPRCAGSFRVLDPTPDQIPDEPELASLSQEEWEALRQRCVVKCEACDDGRTHFNQVTVSCDKCHGTGFLNPLNLESAPSAEEPSWYLGATVHGPRGNWRLVPRLIATIESLKAELARGPEDAP